MVKTWAYFALRTRRISSSNCAARARAQRSTFSN